MFAQKWLLVNSHIYIYIASMRAKYIVIIIKLNFKEKKKQIAYKQSVHKAKVPH